MKQLTLTLVLILSGLASASLYAEAINHNMVDNWPDTRYTVDADKGTVIDTVTGLMWRQCADGETGITCEVGTVQTYIWAKALRVPAVANAVALGGYTDWRLPNIKELISLHAFNRSELPEINATIFPNGLYGFWSSTTTAVTTNGIADAGAWVISFLDRKGDGERNKLVLRGEHYAVRLVRDAD